jgi:hypothetical protein
MKPRTLLLISLALLPPLAFADVPSCAKHAIPLPGRATFLVPLFIQKQPGAFGSLWSAELAVYNHGQHQLEMYDSCQLSACSFQILRPGDGRLFTQPIYSTPRFPAQFFSIPSNAGDLAFSLRVFDENSLVPNWGTYVPVVRWDTLPPGPILLINVPISTETRATLRIYAASGPTPVTIRYYDQASGSLLAASDATAGSSPCEGGYLQSALPETLTGASRVRIVVEPLDPAVVIWGMVSITDRDSRQVTIVPSQPVAQP